MAARSVVDVTLTPLALNDARDLLAFELENRAWFEAWVGPRPDSYWRRDSLDAIIRGQLDDPDAMFLIRVDGVIAGRLNLTGIADSVAQIGYRVGADYCGQGIASRAVELAFARARDLGLWALEARVRDDNPASGRVLVKTGFVPESRVEGMTIYRRALA